MFETYIYIYVRVPCKYDCIIIMCWFHVHEKRCYIEHVRVYVRIWRNDWLLLARYVAVGSRRRNCDPLCDTMQSALKLGLIQPVSNNSYHSKLYTNKHQKEWSMYLYVHINLFYIYIYIYILYICVQNFIHVLLFQCCH
jgi:hypothetical protein